MPIPSIDDIRAHRKKLGDLVVETPVWAWRGDAAERLFGRGAQVFLKLELLQYAGSFKPRGALTRMLALSSEERAQGVTAVSAGNHAAAVAYAARVCGTTAKVVMPQHTNPARIALCESFGAEVVLVSDVHAAFDEVKRIEAEEGRLFVHPFDGDHVVLGAATLGVELCAQCPELDAVIAPVGGGGLCSGVSAAVKQMRPQCLVFGVEPYGADTMYRSFQSGKPESMENVDTIADSLAPPHAGASAFEVCRRFVDEVVRVDDDALCEALYLLFKHVKLAVEPAGAAATAALLGPLRERLAGKRVGLIVCGANIDTGNFTDYLRRGEERDKEGLRTAQD